MSGMQAHTCGCTRQCMPMHAASAPHNATPPAADAANCGEAAQQPSPRSAAAPSSSTPRSRRAQSCASTWVPTGSQHAPLPVPVPAALAASTRSRALSADTTRLPAIPSTRTSPVNSRRRFITAAAVQLTQCAPAPVAD
eukprot:m.293432 g.293432  ORF g.293432 m.293432 type:complete len:139 (-) comp55123_c0_seq1:60-476(-)